MLRYTLRTLLIVLALGPVVLAWAWSHRIAMLKMLTPRVILSGEDYEWQATLEIPEPSDFPHVPFHNPRRAVAHVGFWARGLIEIEPM